MNPEQEFSQAEYDYYWNLNQQERDQLLENEQTLDLIRALLLFQQGQKLAEKEEFHAAISSYNIALDIKPNYYKAWEQKGESLYFLDRYKEAIDSYDKVLEIKSDDDWAWTKRGNALANLNRYEEAIDSYDKAIEINSDSDRAWRDRGDALSKLNRYGEAIDSYDKAIEINSDYCYWAWTRRGDALSKLNRYEEAIDSYDKAIEINSDSDYYWDWVDRGDALSKLNRYEEAVLYYDEILEQKSQFKLLFTLRKSEIIKSNNKFLPYLTNRWASGRRTFWGNLFLTWFIFKFPILLCTPLALIFLFQGTFLAQILTGILYVVFTSLAILGVAMAIIELRKNIKFPYKTYLKSGFLSYVRAFLIFVVTVLVSTIIYTYSPNLLRFGWGQLVFADSGNWAITQPFEMADQAAETANIFSEHLTSQAQEIPNKSRARSNQFNFRWIFIPAAWLLLILVLPFWSKWEEETYRKGIHTWKGITVNSIKFGLAHLIMGIPIFMALSLSVSGFLFACRYKYVYQRHLRKFGNKQDAQEAGVFASTADHAIYNAIAITLLTYFFLF